jgi:RNA-dependent RNA polymerase
MLANCLGRWTTYLFEFRAGQNPQSVYEHLKQALQDFNIEIDVLKQFGTVPSRPAELWSIIDPPTYSAASLNLQHLESDSGTISLPFEVRYQLDVCISRELLNEYNISRGFIAKLAEIASTNVAKARNLLEYVAEEDERVYDPMTIFVNNDALSFSVKTDIPHYCAYSRKATITPSTIYFSSPTVETTNRVLRNYSRENRDGRFLRVQFTDEVFEVCCTSFHFTHLKTYPIFRVVSILV